MAHGRHLDVGLESVRVGVPELLELGRPCQRADHVDVDAVLAPLGGGDAGHTADALLGGSIGRLAEVAEEASAGSEVDDAAVRLSQIGVAGFHVVESGVEAGVDGQIELLGGVLGQRHAGGRADIGLHGQHLDAVEAFQLLLGCFQLLDIAACDDEVRALLGVCGGDAVADGAAAPILQDSAPCAGNDGGFTS